MVSTETEAVGFIFMAKTSELVEKDIGMSNAAWKSIKQRANGLELNLVAACII